MSTSKRPPGRHLHQRVEVALRELVGGHEVGALLPPETQLADQLGVSRGTVRAAMDRLVAAGLVRRTPGRGTEVLQAEHGSEIDFTAVPFRLHGGVEDVTVARATVRRRRARTDEIDALQLGGPQEVNEITRWSVASGRPFALNITVFAPFVPLPDELRGRWASALAREGIHLVRYADAISARAANSRVARALRIEPGDPVLVVRRIAYGADGRPAEFSLLYLRSESTYHVEQRG